MTEITIASGFGKLLGPPFWAALRAYVVPARKLRKLYVLGIPNGLSMSDDEPLLQLRGSLEELGLWGSEYGNPSIGLHRFPEAFSSLSNLQNLALNNHFRIEAIPAGISNLKKLQRLAVYGCDLGSLPKELGALTQLSQLFRLTSSCLSLSFVSLPPLKLFSCF